MNRTCTYQGNDTGGERCTRDAQPGWTTCARHYTAGRSTRQDRRPGLFDLRKQLGRAPTAQEYRDARR